MFSRSRLHLPVAVALLMFAVTACLPVPDDPPENAGASSSDDDVSADPIDDGGIPPTDVDPPADAAPDGAPTCEDEMRIHRAFLTQPPANETTIAEPVAVPIAFDSLDSLAAVLDEGETVWFTDTNEDPIPHEVIRLTASTGEMEAWVSWPDFARADGSEIIMFVGPASQAPSAGSMWATNIGVWHFTETDTSDPFVDSSSHENHGSAPAGASLVPGIVGTSVALDGTEQRVLVPDSSSLRVHEYTIMAWIRLDELANAGIVNKIFADPDNVRRSYGLNTRLDGTLVAFGTPVNSTTFSTFANDTQSPLVRRDTWTHVTYTRSQAEGVVLYLDGERVHEQAFNQELQFDDGPLHIGADQNNDGVRNLLSGRIDEVIIDSVRRGDAWVRLSYLAQSSDAIEVGEFSLDRVVPCPNR